MIPPAIRTGIEEADQLSGLRHERRDIASLVAIAGQAGTGQVVLSRKPAVLLANDVVHLTSEERVILMNEAVLAEMSCAISYEPTQLRRDMAWAHCAGLLRYFLARAFARRMMCSSWR